MSQTLAQRRALSAFVRDRDAPSVAATGLRASDPDDVFPASGPAARVMLSLVRTGARVVDIGPWRVVLRRSGAECEIDPAGRVRWRPR